MCKMKVEICPLVLRRKRTSCARATEEDSFQGCVGQAQPGQVGSDLIP